MGQGQGHMRKNDSFTYFINKVKVIHQGQGHIKVKVNYLLPFQLYVKFYLFKHINPLYMAIGH